MTPHTNSQYEGQLLRGKIVNTGGTTETPDPIAIMDKDVPYVVINNLDSSEAELGQRVKVRIEKALDRVMFGDIEDKEEKNEATNPDVAGENYRVEFQMFGYSFSSDTLGSEAAAEDLAQFLEQKIGREISVERTR